MKKGTQKKSLMFCGFCGKIPKKAVAFYWGTGAAKVHLTKDDSYVRLRSPVGIAFDERILWIIRNRTIMPRDTAGLEMNCTMSLRDYLSIEQIQKIVNIIRETCDEYSKEEKDKGKRTRVGKERFDRIMKGRKAHKITGDVYISIFDPANKIDDIELFEVQNGSYSQPELITKSIILHVYYSTNTLDSALVKDRMNGSKPFFCLLFSVDSDSKLKTIKSVCFQNGERSEEDLCA